MTVEEAKDILIAWANRQVGTHEGTNNWNKYASSPDMTKLYGWNVQNQPWCDVWVDAGFIECFGYDVGSAMTYQYSGCNGAACSYSADYYKARSAWYHDPERGDQIFFLVGGQIGHTGIVTDINYDGTIITVEGNSSDMVARRTYSVNDRSIAGYGRPNWSIAGRDIVVPTTPTAPVEPPAEPKPESVYHKYIYKVPLNLLKAGDYGPLVKTVQILLNAYGYLCEEDGEFGEEMFKAVKQFQSDNDLFADGEVGGLTYHKLLYYGG